MTKVWKRLAASLLILVLLAGSGFHDYGQSSIGTQAYAVAVDPTESAETRSVIKEKSVMSATGSENKEAETRVLEDAEAETRVTDETEAETRVAEEAKKESSNRESTKKEALKSEIPGVAESDRTKASDYDDPTLTDSAETEAVKAEPTQTDSRQTEAESKGPEGSEAEVSKAEGSEAESNEEERTEAESSEEDPFSLPVDNLKDLEEIENDIDYEHYTSISPILLLSINAEVSALALNGVMEKSSCVTFETYKSPYWHCYRYQTTGSHRFYHRYYCNQISYHMIDGEYAYCIEPNTVSVSDISYKGYTDGDAAKDSYWKAELDSKQRNHIKKILACSYPRQTYGYGKRAQYAAAQTLIWEVVSKCRYSSLDSCSDKGLYNNVAKVLGADYRNAYEEILSNACNTVSDGKVPSFAGKSPDSPKTIELTYNADTGCLEASVKDTNGVLPHYSFSRKGVVFTPSSSKLSISIPLDKADEVKGKVITGTSDQLSMDTSNPNVWENVDYQTVVTNGGADKMKAYIKLDWTDLGSIKVTKMANHTVAGKLQPESGAVFRVWIKSAGSYADAPTSKRAQIKIGTDGTGVSKMLPLGTYCLKQYSGWEGYDLIEETKTVKITKLNEVVTRDTNGTSLSFKDNIWTGKIKILKIDGLKSTPLQGAVFELTGSDGSKRTAVTDKNGRITFDNLTSGVDYHWQETVPPKNYEINSGCKGDWSVKKQDAVLSVTCENYEDTCGVIRIKKTNYKGKVLAGCTFRLEYQSANGWKPVFARNADNIVKGGCTSEGLSGGSLTTGSDGTVVFTGLYAHGTKYRLKETAAPSGYELAASPVVFEGTIPFKQKLSSLAKNYKVEAPNRLEDGTVLFYDLSFTVRDGKKFKLPLTGGQGLSSLMAMIGIWMAALGLMLILKREEKQTGNERT